MGVPLQCKQTVLFTGQSAATNATVTGIVDTKGFAFATVDVFAASAATNKGVTTLDLLESDDTVATNAATWSGSSLSTAGLPLTVAYGYKANIDLRGRKRYLRVKLTPKTNNIYAAVANLFKGDESPDTTTKAKVVTFAEI